MLGLGNLKRPEEKLKIPVGSMRKRVLPEKGNQGEAAFFESQKRDRDKHRR